MTVESSTIDSSLNDSNVRNTFRLLEEGEQTIVLNELYKNVTLVLGNAGAGKSTFIQWIAGDNDRLFAKETVEGSGEFIIEDGNRIGNNAIESRTLFPELVIDNENNAAFYDCPGFSDTRSTSHEIAISYFIKRILDHSSNVKIVFIVSYPLVRKGVHKQDFINLMRHSTNIVQDVDKFLKSIAIVVTKVDNQFIKEGRSYNLVSDKKVVETIAEFFRDVKQGLTERLEMVNISSMDRKFYEKVIKLVDIFLKNNDEIYTRIGIFRRPDESGVLSNITLLQDGKKHIKKILFESLEFTAKNNDDFGYTVSDRAKNDIKDLVQEIYNNVEFNVNDVVQKVTEHYRYFVEQIHSTIKTIVNGTDTVHFQQYETEQIQSKLKELKLLHNLVEDVKNLNNIQQLAEKLKEGLNKTDISTITYETNVSNISNQGKYFDFLQVVNNGELTIKSWEILFQHFLNYVSDSQRDIQYYVIEGAENVSKKIYYLMKHLATEVEIHYHKKMELFTIQKLPNELHKGYSVMLNITNEYENLNNIQRFSQKMCDNILELGVEDHKIRNTISFILQQEKYLHFLQILSTTRWPNWVANWENPFRAITSYLHDSEKWYIFLDDLRAKFTGYQIQENTSKYNVANVVDWGLPNKPQGLVLTRDNFHHFLEKIGQYNITQYDAVKGIEVSELRLREINEIIHLTLKSGVKVECPDRHTLVIKGHHIKFSDFIQANGKLDDLCGNRDVLKSVNVFALNTVFIDRNLEEVGQRLNVSIVAPQWKIINYKKIILDGSPGATRSPKNAKDGSYAGQRGSDGVAGLPGGSAGCLLGIGREFVNGGKLTISADGGKGGVGQDGGNGAHGRNGEDAPKPGCDERRRYRLIKIHEKSGTFGGFIETKTYISPGANGGKGGDGGNGGTGGVGGNSGNVILHYLEENPGITILSSPGRKGENGKGGLGTPGGKNGDDYEIECVIETATGTDGLNPVSISRLSREPPRVRKIGKNDRASAGNNGTEGSNNTGQALPDPALTLEQVRILNDYKSYLRENLNNRFTRNTLKDFFRQLNNNNKLTDVYTTLGLTDELQDLENQLHKLNKEDVIMAYQFLLNRIISWQTNQNHENSSQYKKIRSYLYTTILSRMYNEKRESDSILIVDIHKYLDIVKQNIRTLAELQDESNKIEVVNKYKENYKTTIDKKITEANHFIETYIKSAITNINDELDNNVHILINETIALQAEAREEKQQLMEKKKELEHALELRTLFSCLKITGAVLGFLGPIGTIAGTAIGASAAIAETIVIDYQAREQQNIELPSSVTQNFRLLEAEIKSTKDQKVASFNKLLEEISQETNKYPDHLKDTSAKIADIKDKLRTCNEPCSSNRVQELEDELQQEFKRREGELKSGKVNVDQKTATAIAVIGKFNRALQVSTVSFDIYNTYKNDETGLNAMSEAINQAENKLQKLIHYESSIYDNLAPMLQTMIVDLNDIQEKLNTKSVVALDVAKWQVQSSLKGIKLKMHQLTVGYQVHDDFSRCIEKLEEATTTLMDIYDRIQNYQEQQKLSAYIADISSAAASSIHIADANLNIAVKKLEISIRSNLIKRQYSTAVDAFKTWIFPFAHNYLAEFAVPSHLKLNLSTDNIAFETEQRIESIKSKIEQYKISIDHYDEILHNGEFTSNFTVTNPFFVWENNKHKIMISKLLSGEKVVAKADVINSPSDKDAIKFNVIDFQLRSVNTTIQSEINNKLKGFKISATHLGNSYYRCNDKFYVITGNYHNIQYSFEKNSNGEPVHSNNVYMKLKRGDFMLSPYTMWEIQLLLAARNFSFHELAMYKDDVSLELAGFGNYVSGKVDLRAENYYKVDDITDDPTNAELEANKLLLQNSISRKRRSAETRRVSKQRLVNSNQSNNLSSQSANSLKTNSALRPSLSENVHNSFRTNLYSSTNNTPEIGIHLEDTISVNQKVKHISKIENVHKEKHNLQASTRFGDIKSNFMLGQLIVGMVFGKNKSLSSNSYISPEQQHKIKINELARRIVPILKLHNDYPMDNRTNWDID